MKPEQSLQPNIELHIEELVLHGFPLNERAAIGTAVEGELMRLLSDHGVPTSLVQRGDVASLDGGSFTSSRGAKPGITGTQIAQAVFQGINK